MKIDEPDTPWASPRGSSSRTPSPSARGRRRTSRSPWTTSRIACATWTTSGGGPRRGGTDPRATTGVGRLLRRGDQPGGRRGLGESGRRPRRRDRSVRREGEAEEAGDAVLKARLFEAQRKSHQCTFRGVMARGRAMLEEEEEEEEDAQGGWEENLKNPFLRTLEDGSGTNEGGAGRSAASWEEKTHPDLERTRRI